jgi:hypothetical protein
MGPLFRGGGSIGFDADEEPAGVDKHGVPEHFDRLIVGVREVCEALYGMGIIGPLAGRIPAADDPFGGSAFEVARGVPFDGLGAVDRCGGIDRDRQINGSQRGNAPEQEEDGFHGVG